MSLPTAFQPLPDVDALIFVRSLILGRRLPDRMQRADDAGLVGLLRAVPYDEAAKIPDAVAMVSLLRAERGRNPARVEELERILGVICGWDRKRIGRAREVAVAAELLAGASRKRAS
jgi:hypothetical protein